MFLAFILSLLLLTSTAVSAADSVRPTPDTTTRPKGAKPTATNTNDLVEIEYQKLLDDDDTTQEEVDKMIKADHSFAEKGAPFSAAALQLRIDQRLGPIRKAYEDFLQRHPDHARAHVAFGSFLNDLNEELKAVEHWEKARRLDPSNPAVWNNLANYYGHRGPTARAFEFYEKAIELNPKEPVYYHNFGTTVFLFRKDAQEYYKFTEQQVFDRALELYHQAIKLDPANFPLATDIAQTYYGITPTRTNDALAAWDYALKVARDDIEREGIYIHQARFKMNVGRFDEARAHLNAVTNSMYNDLKTRLTKNLELKEAKAKGTNSPPPVVEKKSEN